MGLKSSIIALGLLSVAQGGFAEDTVRIIVKYKQQPRAVAALKTTIANSLHMPVQALNPMANGAYSLILKTDGTPFAHLKPGDSTATVLEQIRKNPNVLYAVKDRLSYFKPVPNPVSQELSSILTHESQWDEFKAPAGVMLESAAGLKDGAWALTTGKAKNPVVVAVLDTGIALNDSIVNSLVKNEDGSVFGWNFAGNNNDLSDETDSYHGTHVAGTIAGYGSVMNGMGEDLKVLPLKIPGKAGMFYESAVVNAIYWSVGADVPGVPKNKFPAKVLNMSFGVDEKPGKEIAYCDEALQEAVFYARKKGAVLAVAAGNDNVWEHYNAPGSCNGTIKVAATGPEGFRSYFSNYGPSTTLAAPGGDKRYGDKGGILSTVNPGGGYNASGFDFYQGTSMASPHVAGVAGLVYAASEKNLKAEQVEQLLYVTTHDFGKSSDANKSCVGKKPCGHGILDANQAVKAAMAHYDVLFAAPVFSALGAKACANGLLIAGNTTIKAGNSVWVQTHAACESVLGLQTPHVKQNKDGSITAHYGVLTYKLDQSAYSSCNVIGFDGIGCYL